jgi:hypothetical protein
LPDPDGDAREEISLTRSGPRVLVLFMSDAATAPSPTAQPTPAEPDKNTRSGRLLGLIYRLIDYGKELATTVRHRVQTEPFFAVCHFGTSDLAQILASISRGLHLASALEARVLRNAGRLDTVGRATGAASPRKPRLAAPATPPADETDRVLARMPTPARIAAEIRKRSIGAVLADICRDLGITPSHPLWEEVHIAMLHHGGNYVRLFFDVLKRAMPQPTRTGSPPPAGLRGPALQFSAPAATGPP